MKQYVLDELRLEDYSKIKDYFECNFSKSGIHGLYWINLEHEILSDVQKEHNKCIPFYFAINLQEHKLSCELLIRSKNQIQCKCISYATVKQRNWIINFIDTITEQLKITT